MYLNIRLTLFISFIFAYTSLLAQLSVAGQLQDEQAAPLAYANVMLLQATDSSFVQGAVSADNGQFELTGLAPGDYILQIAMLGYQDIGRALPLEANTVLPPITLKMEGTDLAMVEVKADRPLLEQRGNKLVVDVANSVTGTSGSAMDLLRKVPGLLVINNQISMAGQSGIAILINGKPTRYLDVQSLLRDFPAENIARIEVINQPGARYEAEGNGGVLNIILKKNVLLGTNGSVRLRAGKGRFWKYGTAASLNYRDERINLSNHLAYNHSTSYEEMVLDRRVGDQTFLQTNRQPYLPHSISLNSSLDYQISEQHEAGVAVQLFGSQNHNTDESTTRILKGQRELQALLTQNRERRQRGLLALDGYYQFKLDTSGHQWSIDASYYRSSRDAVNRLNIMEQPGGEPANFPDQRQEQPGDNRIYSVKADYVLPLSDGHQLDAGLKYSDAFIDNDLRAFEEGGTDDWALLPELSNHFQFSEQITAAYLSYQFEFGNISGQAGLRYEHNHTEGYSVTLDSLNTRRAGRFFPSLSVEVPLAGKMGLTGAYSYRITRPRYGALNPFLLTMDPYTFQKGNPFLRPELTHSTKLTLTYDKQPFFNLEYNRTTDNIQLVTEQNDATGAAFAFPENLGQYDKVGGSLFFPLSILPGFTGYGGVMAHYHRFRSELFGDVYDQDRWSVMAFLQAGYRISDSWSAEVSGWYTGPGVRGIMTYDGLYAVSFGLKKELWDGRGAIELSADDLFFRYWTGEMNHANLDIDILSKWEVQRVNLSFLYKFGNRYLKKGNKRGSSAREEKRRTSN